MIKKLIKIFSIILILLVTLFVGLRIYYYPKPELKRNNSVHGVKVNIKVSNDEREPIVRTFEREKFENFSEKEIVKLRDTIAGRVEGDIPCIHLSEDNKFYVEFINKGKVYEPEIPRIKIFVYSSPFDDNQKQRVIEGELDRLDDGRYYFETKRYSTQFEKYFMEYLRIEIYYTIDGVDYLSTFGTVQSNADDGTNYFENNELEEPIPPEE